MREFLFDLRMWTLPSKVVSLDCLVCPDSISLVAAGCADGRAAVFDVDAWSVVKSEGTWRASGGAGKSGISMKTCVTSKKEKWEGVCVFSWGWFLPKLHHCHCFTSFCTDKRCAVTQLWFFSQELPAPMTRSCIRFILPKIDRHISHLYQYSWHGAVLLRHPPRSMRSVNQWRTPRTLAVWEVLRCMTRVVVWDMKQRTLVIPSRTIWRLIDSPSLVLPKWLWPFSCTHLNNNI